MEYYAAVKKKKEGNLTFKKKFLLKGIFFIAFRERERERERNIDVREKHLLIASCTCPDKGSHVRMPGPGIKRTT